MLEVFADWFRPPYVKGEVGVYEEVGEEDVI